MAQSSAVATLSTFRHEQSTQLVAARFGEVMAALGLDLSDPNLVDTPSRVARAYREMFAGLVANEPVLRTFPNQERYSSPLVVADIPFYSLCAHHFLPFFGYAHIAYLPGERVLGLSKFARVVDHYARRPQLQERLTEQIADLLDRRLKPAGVMVIIEARHFCMEMRGVLKSGSYTTTRAVKGAFNGEARKDAGAMLRGHAARAVGRRPTRGRNRPCRIDGVSKAES
jgi:GTP cyclohydrolase IA